MCELVKEYVEFFCPPENLAILLEVVQRPEFGSISYMAVDRKVFDIVMLFNLMVSHQACLIVWYWRAVLFGELGGK